MYTKACTLGGANLMKVISLGEIIIHLVPLSFQQESKILKETMNFK